MHGPVYYVCHACKQRQAKAIADQLNEEEERFYPDDDGEDDLF